VPLEHFPRPRSEGGHVAHEALGALVGQDGIQVAVDSGGLQRGEELLQRRDTAAWLASWLWLARRSLAGEVACDVRE